MISERNPEAGFTLVELLVALAIFALISVAGVMLLRSGSETQIAVKGRLEALSRSNRLYNSIEADLAQVIARPVRDTSGLPVPAFTQGGATVPDALFGFVRTGWSNFDEAPRAGLQRVTYVLQDGKLKRLSWPMLDGASPVDAAVILDDVKSVQMRFRDERGEWRSDWSAIDPDALPRAVELRLTLAAKPEQRMLFLVGSQARPKPREDDEGAAG